MLIFQGMHKRQKSPDLYKTLDFPRCIGTLVHD